MPGELSLDSIDAGSGRGRSRVVLTSVAARGVRAAAERRLARRCGALGALVLSYDDGPGERLTPRLLELLAVRRRHASFFPLGERAIRAPAVMDRMVADGHEVGCHGFEHVDASRVRRDAAVADIDRGYATLAAWVAPSGLFRPPYGRCSASTFLALRRRGAGLAFWTVDSGDSLLASTDGDQVLRTVVDRCGGVVLMHDFDRDPGHHAREDYVLDLTAALLDAAAGRGLEVMTLGRLP